MDVLWFDQQREYLLWEGEHDFRELGGLGGGLVGRVLQSHLHQADRVCILTHVSPRERSLTDRKMSPTLLHEKFTY